MDIQEAIRVLEQAADSVEDGLPLDLFLFASQITPLVSVDLLIKDAEGRTLFTWRDDEFFGRGWHLPGGVIRHNETVAHRIGEVGRIELGATLQFDPKPITFVEDLNLTKKQRGHFFAFLHRCTIESGLDPALAYTGRGDPLEGQWAWFDGTPTPLIQVHEVYRPYY